MSKKYYFGKEDDETCYELDYHMESAEHGSTEISIFKAEKTNFSDIMYCKEFQSVGDKGNCGKVCDKYSPRNGKSGCCKHVGQLYTPGELITFKL